MEANNAAKQIEQNAMNEEIKSTSAEPSDALRTSSQEIKLITESFPIISIVRVQRGTKKFPSFNSGKYGLNLYIGY